jgi:hypothetical protein
LIVRPIEVRGEDSSLIEFVDDGVVGQGESECSGVHACCHQDHLAEAVIDCGGDLLVEEPRSRADRGVLGRSAWKTHLIHPPEALLSGEDDGQRITEEPIRSAALLQQG